MNKSEEKIMAAINIVRSRRRDDNVAVLLSDVVYWELFTANLIFFDVQRERATFRGYSIYHLPRRFFPVGFDIYVAHDYFIDHLIKSLYENYEERERIENTISKAIENFSKEVFYDA